MISDCYFDPKGESVLQDSPPIYSILQIFNPSDSFGITYFSQINFCGERLEWRKILRYLELTFTNRLD